MRQARIDHGWTREYLAHRAGLTLTAVARIESGRTSPPISDIRDVCAALEITLGDVQTGAPP